MLIRKHLNVDLQLLKCKILKIRKKRILIFINHFNFFLAFIIRKLDGVSLKELEIHFSKLKEENIILSKLKDQNIF